MSDFKAKMHLIRFPLGRSPDPQLYLRGPTSKGKRKGRGQLSPPQLQTLGSASGWSSISKQLGSTGSGRPYIYCTVTTSIKWQKTSGTGKSGHLNYGKKQKLVSLTVMLLNMLTYRRVTTIHRASLNGNGITKDAGAT